jgi:hypothetical protein
LRSRLPFFLHSFFGNKEKEESSSFNSFQVHSYRLKNRKNFWKLTKKSERTRKALLKPSRTAAEQNRKEKKRK